MRRTHVHSSSPGAIYYSFYFYYSTRPCRMAEKPTPKLPSSQEPPPFNERQLAWIANIQLGAIFPLPVTKTRPQSMITKMIHWLHHLKKRGGASMGARYLFFIIPNIWSDCLATRCHLNHTQCSHMHFITIVHQGNTKLKHWEDLLHHMGRLGLKNMICEDPWQRHFNGKLWWPNSNQSTSSAHPY